MNTLPGASRPLRWTCSGATVITPVSDASTTYPSVSWIHRPGRSPLRSSTAPATRPSVNTTAAGPSHGSIKHEWKS